MFAELGKVYSGSWVWCHIEISWLPNIPHSFSFGTENSTTGFILVFPFVVNPYSEPWYDIWLMTLLSKWMMKWTLLVPGTWYQAAGTYYSFDHVCIIACTVL